MPAADPGTPDDTVLDGADPVARLARDVFRFTELRPGQREAIDALLAGRDTLAVLPTGSGKSAIYQIAAMLVDGPCVIVSPLIALQRDQVAAIRELDVSGVAAVNSHLGVIARRAAFAGLKDGVVKFLFVAPEQLATPEVVRDIAEAKPTLFVVDEAHCVSAWGHDFRPDYLRLGGVIEALGHPTVLALTATASPPVRDELSARLGMRDPAVVVRGFDRPNIWLDVETFTSEEAKREALVLRAAGELKPGIVYAATRKRAEDLAELIADIGLSAGCYHAGMKAAERRQVQDAFVDDRLDVVVATTAFGMGIDKPNVRFVLHYDVTDSLDSYYQEVGRAGRDGLRSEAVLYYRQEDLGLRRFFAAGAVAVVPLTRVARLLEAAADGPVDLRELRTVARLSTSRLSAVLGQLTHAGFVRVDPTGSLELLPDRPSVERVVEHALGEAETRKTLDQSRVDMIRAYAESHGCRGRLLLSYFGEQVSSACGHCDRCTAGVAVDTFDGPYPVNTRVAHAEWGTGQILRYEDDKVVVLFDTVGYKTLSVPAVISRGLLQAELMHDAVVVGGGPAGLSAATWLARYRRRTLLVDAGEHRNRWVEESHGYFTRDAVSPRELLAEGVAQLAAYPFAESIGGTATAARRAGDGFVVTVDGAEHACLRLVLATGVMDAFPEVEGFFDHYGADVFHCPSCDGYEARGRNVVVLGWTEHVAAFAVTLLDWAASVTLVTDGRSFPGDAAQRAALASYGVRVVEDVAERFVGSRGALSGIALRGAGLVPCELAFFSVAHRPRHDLAVALGAELSEDGCVVVDEDCRTTVARLYACGDVTPGMQLIQLAAAKGAVAGISAAQSLRGSPGAPASPEPAPDPEVVAP